MLKDYLTLIRKLPPILNVAWSLMHVGLAIMIVGLVKDSGLLVQIGTAPIAVGAIISWYYRGRMSEEFFGAVLLGIIS